MTARVYVVDFRQIKHDVGTTLVFDVHYIVVRRQKCGNDVQIDCTADYTAAVVVGVVADYFHTSRG